MLKEFRDLVCRGQKEPRKLIQSKQLLALLAAAEAAGKDWQHGLIPLFELHSLT